ncbi:hypothetical protein [Sphingomonas sp. NIBR02145]|uniref:hypothetical protein n=1 Tax=Sphingomonas sp. NIBR02145 TaxID=3014784 RepID=UPI0022B510BB|nr:hypothetical protein [Sphingomonas sp. NIBR02145]WHU02273.1 hypothetical protein O3305_19125 [Sphingomonas sp. NIBR02145]
MKTIRALLVLLDAKLRFTTTKEMLLGTAYVLFDLTILVLFVSMLWRAFTIDKALFVFWIPFLSVVIFFRGRQILKWFRALTLMIETDPP